MDDWVEECLRVLGCLKSMGMDMSLTPLTPFDSELEFLVTGFRDLRTLEVRRVVLLVSPPSGIWGVLDSCLGRGIGGSSLGALPLVFLREDALVAPRRLPIDLLVVADLEVCPVSDILAAIGVTALEGDADCGDGGGYAADAGRDGERIGLEDL